MDVSATSTTTQADALGAEDVAIRPDWWSGVGSINVFGTVVSDTSHYLHEFFTVRTLSLLETDIAVTPVLWTCDLRGSRTSSLVFSNQITHQRINSSQTPPSSLPAVQVPQLILDAVPNDQDRRKVEGVLSTQPQLVAAILNAISYMRALSPEASVSLVSDPEDEWDLPLTLYIEIPGDYEDFLAKSAALKSWWSASYPSERRYILLSPRPGG